MLCSLRNCVLLCTVAIIVSPSFLLAGPRTSRASIIKYQNSLRQVLGSINDSATSATLARVGQIPQRIGQMGCGAEIPSTIPADPEFKIDSCPVIENLKVIEGEIRKILAEGPIDLRINYQGLYQLIKQQMQARMTANVMPGLISEIQSIKGEIEGLALSPEEAAVRALGVDYEGRSQGFKNAADQIKALSVSGSGLSSGGLQSAISRLIEQIRGVTASGNAQSALIAVIVELESLKQHIGSTSDMKQRERDAIGCILPALPKYAGALIDQFTELYASVGGSLKGIADQMADGADGSALQVLADGLDSRISAAQSQQSAALGQVAALEAQITEYRKALVRTEKFRVEEEKIVNIQRPICDEIIAYNQALNPYKLFQAIDKKFVDEAKGNKQLAADFDKINANSIAKQIDGAAKSAQKVMLKEQALPALNARPELVNACGNLYNEPQPPNDNSCKDTPVSDAALNILADGGLNLSSNLAFGSPGSGVIGGGTKDSNKKASCKSYRCKKPGSIFVPTDRFSRLLYKAAKKFMRNKAEVIKDAHKEAYNIDFGS